MNLNRILRSVIFFKYLGDSQIQELAALARPRNAKKGETLFREGEGQNHLFLIERGRVQISRDGANFGRQTFALLGPGDHFGALSLFYPDPHFSTATSFQATRLWIIRHEDFQARLRDEPRMASALVRGMVVGIRMANAEIRKLTTHFNQRSHPTIELPASPLGPLPPPPPVS